MVPMARDTSTLLGERPVSSSMWHATAGARNWDAWGGGGVDQRRERGAFLPHSTARPPLATDRYKLLSKNEPAIAVPPYASERDALPHGTHLTWRR